MDSAKRLVAPWAVLCALLTSTALAPSTLFADEAAAKARVSKLVALLENREGDRFWSVVTRLEGLGKPAVPALVAHLSTSSEKTRLACAIHPVPGLKERAAIRVLLLNQSDNLKLAALLKLFRLLVPPGHASSAACSPRGVYEEEDLLAAEGRDRLLLTARERRQSKIGEAISLTESGLRATLECGRVDGGKAEGEAEGKAEAEAEGETEAKAEGCGRPKHGGTPRACCVRTVEEASPHARYSACSMARNHKRRVPLDVERRYRYTASEVWVLFFDAPERVSTRFAPARGDSSVKTVNIVLLALILSSTNTYAQVTHWRMVKGPVFVQTADDTQPAAADSWAACVILLATDPGDAASVSISGGGVDGSLEFEQDGNEWYLEVNFDDQAAMNALFPSSTEYTIEISGGSLGTLTQSFTFHDEQYPNVPYLTGSSWTDAQSANASSDLTLNWNSPGPLTADSGVSVFEVISLDDEDVYRELTINGATSGTVPAGTLTAGESYEGFLEFTNARNIDGAGGFGVDGTVSHNVALDFRISAIGGTKVPLWRPWASALAMLLLVAVAGAVMRRRVTA